MNKNQRIKQVSGRSERTTYRGRASEYQTAGSQHKGKRYVRYEHPVFTEYQNFLYKRALFGLSVYNKEEIKDMRSEKRKRIQKVHRRTQAVLNIWKQDIVIRQSNAIFEKLFPSSPITMALLKEHNKPDPKFVNTLTFKSLKIEKKVVVEKLIQEGILPSNFYELKQQPINPQTDGSRISNKQGRDLAYT